MKKINYLYGLLIVGSLSITACGKSKKSGGNPPSKSNQEASQPLIGHLTPDQLLQYKEARTGSCDDYVYHRYLTNYTRKIPLEIVGDEMSMYAELDLFIQPDNIYFIRYREVEVLGYNGSSEYIEDRFNLSKSGRWKIEGGKVIFEGLGVGVMPFPHNRRNALNLTFTQSLNREIVGETSTLSYVLSTSGRHKFRHYCPQNYDLGEFSSFKSIIFESSQVVNHLSGKAKSFGGSVIDMTYDLFLLEDNRYFLSYRDHDEKGYTYTGVHYGEWRTTEDYLDLWDLGKLYKKSETSATLVWSGYFYAEPDVSYLDPIDVFVGGKSHNLKLVQDGKLRSELDRIIREADIEVDSE